MSDTVEEGDACTGTSCRSIQFQRDAQTLLEDVATSFAQCDNVPWRAEDVHKWSAWRVRVARFAFSRYTESVLSLVVLFNFGLIIFETDQEAKCYPEFESKLDECPTSHKNILWLPIANDVLLGVYSIEAIVRVYALRFDYFKNSGLLRDFILCALSLFFKISQSMFQSGDTMTLTWLRIVRCVRIVRTSRFAKHQELHVLLSGFKACAKALFYGSLILLALLCIFSIIAVQLVHPHNSQIKYDGCTRCPKGFQSVSDSMLTLYQQIIAGDSWGAISVPVIETTWWGLVLPIFQVVIGLGAMNCILAVVVDQSMEARENHRASAAQKRAKTLLQRKTQLLELVRKMDCDGSGDIDIDEIMDAARTNAELQERVALAGLRNGELREIIDAIASPTKRAIEYMTLCEVLDDIDAGHVLKNVVLTKLALSRMQRDVNTRLDKQSEELTSISRKLDQILAPHPEVLSPGNADGVHAPTHSATIKQDRFTGTSDLRSNFQQSCSLNVSTVAFDLLLEESIIKKIQSCQAEVDRESNGAQQSLTQLHTKWSDSLRALEQTSLAFADSAEGHEANVGFLDHAIRTQLILDAAELSFWTSQYSALRASDALRAGHERPFRGNSIHSSRFQQVLLL